MSSRCRDVAGALILAALVGLGAARGAFAGTPAPLRVCADPNNMPFSSERGEGFDNRIAELIARRLGTTVTYTWWAEHRGFLRHTLRAGLCDVVMGVPAGLDAVLTTAPYYRSTYALVYPRARAHAIGSLDDPALRTLRIGVQMIGNDGVNTPPAHALARRGLVDNVVGFMVQGDHARPDPAARIVEAVARHEVDVGVVWGPVAGFFASRQPEPLAVVPLPASKDPALPFAFDICVGVRRDAADLRRAIDDALARLRPEIDRVLDEYHVPRLPVAAARRGA